MIADFDGDGRQDVAVILNVGGRTDPARTVAVFLNTSSTPARRSAGR